MTDGHIELWPILEDELYSAPALMPVVVAKLVGHKKDVERVFQLTKDITSTDDLKHLKRLRNTKNGQLECIICKLGKNLKSLRLDGKVFTRAREQLELLEARFAPENILKDFSVALVPSEAPRTEHQLRACRKLWPCKYAKNSYLNRYMDGSEVSKQERTVVKTLVKHLLGELKLDHETTDAAVILRHDKIYGVGLSVRSSYTKGNPTHHCALLAIDSVARNANSGHNKIPNQEEKKFQDSLQKQLNLIQDELKDHKEDPNFVPYICNDYDVIMTTEPCMMCTMGLVQSRIRRLYFMESNASTCFKDGAIEKYQIHRARNLNHRFEAWKIKMF